MTDMRPTGGLDAITLRNVMPGTFGLTLLAAASQAVAITALSLTTVAKTDAANIFTLGQTIQAAAGLTIRQAATQDALILAGSGVGASSRAVTIVGPATALGASRTFRLPDADVIAAGSASALTSGRVPFVTTGGLLTNDAGLTYAGAGTLNVGDGTASISVRLNGLNNTVRELRWQTAGLARWRWYVAGNETGSNAGGDFNCDTFNDAGAYVDTPIYMVRAAGGAITLARPVTCSLALSAASITATGLTAGLVPFIGTGGLLVNDSGYLYGTAVTTGVGSAGKAVSVGNGVAGANVAMVLNSILTQHKVISFQDGGLIRWALADIATSAQFELRAHDVSGVYIDAPIVVVNAAGGAITLARPVIITGTAAATYTAARTDIGGGRILTAEIGLGVAISAGNGLLQLSSGTTVANAVRFGETPIYRLSAGSLVLDYSLNSSTVFYVKNADPGASATARVLLDNGTLSGGIQLTGTGGAVSGEVALYATGNVAVKFLQNGGERMRINANGLLVGATANIGTERLLVSGGTIATPTATDVVAGAGILSAGTGLRCGLVGGGLSIKEGTNATMGVATLVAGTVTVATTKITASSRVFISVQSQGGTPGFVEVTARVAATSFTLTSSNAADTSVVAWMIVEPAP